MIATLHHADIGASSVSRRKVRKESDTGTERYHRSHLLEHRYPWRFPAKLCPTSPSCPCFFSAIWPRMARQSATPFCISIRSESFCALTRVRRGVIEPPVHPIRISKMPLAFSHIRRQTQTFESLTRRLQSRASNFILASPLVKFPQAK